MAPSLKDVQQSLNAVFDVDRAVPLSFGNDATALQAAEQEVAIYDRSHWGRLEFSEADRLTFLHNQTTNNCQALKPSQGCDTVFVTSTARTIDLVTAYVLEDTVLVLVSPQRREKLLQWCDRYIFFGDKVQVTDVTDRTATFNLIGPASHELLTRLGIEPLPNQPYASHRQIELAGQSVRLAIGSSLATEGYTLILSSDSAAPVWQALVETGAVPMGEQVWEQLRIAAGRPAPDRELTDDYNPLEAGLWPLISFNKGCYIGQETIARLDTYKGVKQRLWGIHLPQVMPPGTVITHAAEKVGLLTSIVPTETGAIGLAYIRTKAGGAGLQVQVGEVMGEIVEVPFLHHDRAQG